MASFSLLVTLHNLVNIPAQLAAENDRQFTVEAQLRDAVTTSFSAPPASASFTASDIVESSPHLFEVQLDKVSRPGSLNSAKVWRCAASSLEVVIVVRESAERAGQRDRVIATSAPISISPREVVEWEKLATRIVGTEVGQVGVSFRVDPADRMGYRTRLEAFLRQYNPQVIRLIDSVVEAVPETDTFAKLYKKYKLVDYPKRLKAFFSIYGPGFVAQIQSLLKQWENKEMELMNHLILDNGPEMKDVDPSERLAAFLSAYDLEADSARIRELRTRAGCSTSEDLLAALVQAYGPEPDPRTYTFPPTRYSSASESSPMMSGRPASRPTTPPRGTVPQLATSSSKGESSQSPPSEGRYLSLAMTSPLPTRPAQSSRQADNAHDDVNNDEPLRGPEKRSATAPGTTPDDFYADLRFGDAQRPARTSEPHGSSAGIGRAENGAEAWRRLCESLGSEGRRGASGPAREADLFYGTAEDFEHRLDALRAGLTRAQKDVLIVEWETRARQALQMEPLLQDDPYFGSAAKEAVRLTGLESLHLHVMTVTAVFHREHHAAFAARLDAAKERKAERLVLVGDATTLEKIARRGLKPISLPEGASRPPSAVFMQRPFQHWTSRHTTGMLICDVVVGHAYVNPNTVSVPAEGTSAFLQRYDSNVFVDKANGPAVAVYEPQQVLPRLLIHCTVDPTVVACPAHPDRAVEYYVADCDAFACSRCVVLGEYRGKEVTTIKEAAVLARARLAEVHRTTLALRDSMDAFEKQLEQETAMMVNAPRRVRAEREVERLRREVEEKIRLIQAEVERADKEQLERIRLDRKELEATRDGALRLCDTIEKHTRESVNPVQVVSALQKVQQDRELEQLLERAEHRIPDAPLEKVAPLAGLPLPPAPQPQQESSPTSPARFAGGYGLNDSRVAGPRGGVLKTSDGVVTTSAPSRGLARPQDPYPAHNTAATDQEEEEEDNDSALYDKYIRALAKNASSQGAMPPPSLMTSHPRPAKPATEDATSIASSSAPPRPAPVTTSKNDGSAAKEARRALTKGWALLRQGDVDGARGAWESVCRAGDSHTTAVGAKAQAYIAEAIDKDYAAAGQWYAQSLRMDPNDRMTAYNYGVLLEALLEQPGEALKLYDRAAALGDKVAATRAEQLRAALQSPSADSATPC